MLGHGTLRYRTDSIKKELDATDSELPQDLQRPDGNVSDGTVFIYASRSEDRDVKELTRNYRKMSIVPICFLTGSAILSASSSLQEDRVFFGGVPGWISSALLLSVSLFILSVRKSWVEGFAISGGAFFILALIQTVEGALLDNTPTLCTARILFFASCIAMGFISFQWKEALVPQVFLVSRH